MGFNERQDWLRPDADSCNAAISMNSMRKSGYIPDYLFLEYFKPFIVFVIDQPVVWPPLFSSLTLVASNPFCQV
jgi:hypothetical protein